MKRLLWWFNRRRFPDQAWYWTPEWQKGERETMREYRAGNYVEFTDTESFMAWLNE